MMKMDVFSRPADSGDPARNRYFLYAGRRGFGSIHPLSVSSRQPDTRN